MIMVVYVVMRYTQENGGRCEYSTHGAYKDKEKALAKVDELFHKDCDNYGVSELNEYSFVNEDEYHLEDDDFSAWDCGCWIEEQEVL